MKRGDLPPPPLSGALGGGSGSGHGGGAAAGGGGTQQESKRRPSKGDKKEDKVMRFLLRAGLDERHGAWEVLEGQLHPCLVCVNDVGPQNVPPPPLLPFRASLSLARSVCFFVFAFFCNFLATRGVLGCVH